MPLSVARVCKAKASEPEPASLKRVGAHGLGGHLRQVALLLLVGAPAQQGIVDQRVLHVDDHAGRGVHARQFFHRQDRLEELGAASAVLLGNLNAHQAKLEEIMDEIFVEDGLLVHLLHQRTNFLVGELADVVAEEDFVFGERGQRGGRGDLQSGFRHEDTFIVGNEQTVNVSTAGESES